MQPDTLESAMMALVILIFCGIIFTVGAAISDALDYWSRHNRAIRAGRQASYNREERKHG